MRLSRKPASHAAAKMFARIALPDMAFDVDQHRQAQLLASATNESVR